MKRNLKKDRGFTPFTPIEPFIVTPQVPQGKSRQGFTLIELLIVIAIIAVLALVVVLAINPAELLKQARDSNRVSDMASFQTSLNIYISDALNGDLNLGSSSVVYVSIPDPAATSTLGDQCQGLGFFPPLASPYVYHCAASSTFQMNDGNGWVPVNFKSMSSGSPLNSLPVDPVNASSSGLFYTYQTNGSQYEITALMESQKYQYGGSADKVSSDGGYIPVAYEVGTSPALSALTRSLWPGVGDFEGSDNGFTTYSGGTFSWTNAYGSVFGSNAEFVTASASLAGSNYGGVLKNFPTSTTLTVGKKYMFMFYAKSIANAGLITVSNQNGIGDNSCLAFGFTPTAKWQLYSKTCTLDFNKNTLYFWSQSVPSQQFAIDGMQILSVP
jgi:type IV pilus assembly protein PilA